MTTRRSFLGLVGAGAAAALVGCDRTAPSPPQTVTVPPDALLAETPDGVMAIRNGQVEVYSRSVATPDGGTIYLTRAAGSDTDLLTVDARSGGLAERTRLTGVWQPAVASGRVVVLLPPAASASSAPAPGGYAPAARTHTPLLLVGTPHGDLRLDLPGNYAPDAVAGDLSSLFVLDWLPAGAPDHYKVREIPFESGRPSALLGRDKQVLAPEAEQLMRGQRRNAVFSPDQQVLYSLYTNQSPATATPGTVGEWEDDTAFIHTLYLQQHGAYCIDLPEPFGAGPNAAHTMTMGRDGRSLFVVDTSRGQLAVVDTDQLTVVRRADGPTGSGAAFAAATVDTVFVAAGTRLWAVDITGLAVRASWSLPAPATGVLTTGSTVYIGLPSQLQWRDPAGTLLGLLPAAGLSGLTGIIPPG